MALQHAPAAQNRYTAGPSPSGLADVLDLILDKGLVIDLYVRVSLVGIELLTIDARIVVASVDTYLRFAEAVGRMNLEETGDSKGLPDLMEDVTSGAAKSKTKGALSAATDKFDEMFGGDDDEDEAAEEEEAEDDGKRPSRLEREPARRRRKKESDE
jgi:gas vesicle structural protein